ncbi:hypothetical protein BST63_06825 [Bradyrhizobium canariense]|uniref:Transposase n=1 Tax=Bradyrhizobium canariense TaxID=255045 RepID=A0ABX3X8F7_9BRAD|nr:hypothetical protein BSR47_07805 [Bradyrhizobium canariense]OSJ32839.1 hypothetical protein BST63_06825 [Bradyrhizobium canariense]
MPPWPRRSDGAERTKAPWPPRKRRERLWAIRTIQPWDVLCRAALRKGADRIVELVGMSSQLLGLGEHDS